MTRIKQQNDFTYLCPPNMIACSNNKDLDGTTACMEDVKDCPVIDLKIFSGDSTVPNSLLSQEYKVVKSSVQFTGGS